MIRFIAIAVAVVTSVAGDYFVKQGSTAVKESTTNMTLKIFSQPKTLFGVGLLTIHFVALALAFRLAPITLIVPLMATTHILNTIVARTILHEKVNWLRWTGVMVIVLGVTVLSAGE
ncbi:MAG: DMT family transporter [Scytonema sp. PMC 1069.18]|nr:DMT family transporter [Scytonema sp. PMC 1069.18]MEC4886642.1 DMT family transporter [Scytonema sp. PMC 1070.18]